MISSEQKNSILSGHAKNNIRFYLIIIIAIIITSVVLYFLLYEQPSEIQYSITYLPSFRSGSTSPLALNDMGQVVGQFYTTTGLMHAFFWDESTGLTDLGTLGGKESVARDINNSGQVVGYAMDLNGHKRAFLWDENNGMVDLGTLGGKESAANDINNSGQVVGWSNTVENHQSKQCSVHAFLWDKQQGMIDLGTLGGKNSYAKAINDHGQVVGHSKHIRGQQHAFLWHKSTGMSDLTKQGVKGIKSSARDINNNGQVLGVFNTDDNRKHVFILDRDHIVIETDVSAFYALKLNDSGQFFLPVKHKEVKIFSYQLSPKQSESVLLTSTGKRTFPGRHIPRHLNNFLLWDINNKGQMLGHTRPASGGNVAFIINPIK